MFSTSLPTFVVVEPDFHSFEPSVFLSRNLVYVPIVTAEHPIRIVLTIQSREAANFLTKPRKLKERKDSSHFNVRGKNDVEQRVAVITE